MAAYRFWLGGTGAMNPAEGTLQHVDQIKWGNGDCNFSQSKPGLFLVMTGR